MDRLASQGQVDSSGRFAWDERRARRMLAEYQLERSELWLLPLLQAAHLWEAARVDLTFSRDAAQIHVLGCQRPPDLRAWLSHPQVVQMLLHKTLGPLALACQVALAAGFPCIEFRHQEHTVRLGSGGAEGPREEFAMVHNLSLRLQAPEPAWWKFGSRLQWRQRIVSALSQLQARAPFSLAQTRLDGRPALEPPVDRPPHGAYEIERVWLSSQPLRQLMAYPNPIQRPFRHERIGQRLTAWGKSDAAGLLRQWIHAEGGAIVSDLHLGEARYWLDYLRKNGSITLPREVRWRDGLMAVRGLLQWNPESQAAGELIPVRYGITLQTLPLPECPGVVAWLSGDAWTTDLSQQKAVLNALVKKSQDWVRQQFLDLLDQSAEVAHTLPQKLDFLLPLIAKARARARKA